MNMEIIVRCGLIIIGLLLFLIVIRSLAKRTITESFALLWGLLSVILVMGGVLLRPEQLEHYISMKGLVLVIVAGVILLLGLYYFSIQISILQRKNREMAMHIALLNQENEKILKKLEEL